MEYTPRRKLTREFKLEAVRQVARRLTFDETGRASIARQVASPNCDERPDGTPITLAVVHGISLPPGKFGGRAVEKLFTNRLDAAAHPQYAGLEGLRVSAHFFVRREGACCSSSPARSAHGTRACRAGTGASAATTFRSASSSKARTTCRTPARSTRCSRGS